MKRILMLSLLLLCENTVGSEYTAPYAEIPPVIDGIPDDEAWARATWREMAFPIIGELPDADDFSGRYKLVWTSSHLYLLAEISDDRLVDVTADPLAFYWDDDALEVFIDEDASGGLHQFDYNAFAYHISLDNQAVDIGPFRNEEDRKAGKVFVRTFPDHIESRWKRSEEAPHVIYWEVRIAVFGDDYVDGPEGAQIEPVTLTAGKRLGFMLAYCDADDDTGRQHFVGDIDIEPRNGDRNLGYIDASVFGTLKLVRGDSEGTQ